MHDTTFLAPYRPKSALVYNCTTGGINPFHWGEIGTYTGSLQTSLICTCQHSSHSHKW